MKSIADGVNFSDVAYIFGASRSKSKFARKLTISALEPQGRPIQILITPGQAHDLTAPNLFWPTSAKTPLLSIIADKAYEWVRDVPSLASFPVGT
jgi:hypothetical protein